MPKSKVRKKKKKFNQTDRAGNLITSRTKKHVAAATRAVMMRSMRLQTASESLSEVELRELLDAVILRRDFWKNEASPLERDFRECPPKVIMKYIETTLDENGIPIDGETKEMKLCNGDINTLTRIVQTKQQEEDQLKAQTLTKSNEANH